MTGNFFSNLFGVIAKGVTYAPTDMTFIPTDAAGSTIDIKGDKAQWLGLRTKIMQKAAYELCYPLASVIDKLAEFDISGEREILISKGKGKEDAATNDWSNRMRSRMDQPNPLQTWEQFRGQQVVYKKTFGYCPIFPICPIGFDPSYCISMWNLPPWLFSAIPTGKLIYASRADEIIQEYTISILGDNIRLRSDQVFILEDGFIMDEHENFLLPQSKLVGLDMAVSNICAAMEADNVLLKKKGPLGFISQEGTVKDGTGQQMPMNDTEKKELQTALRQYGLSWDQFQYVISTQPAKWNSMSYNVKELGTKETVLGGEKAICHRLSFPYILYEQSDARYAANGENAESGLYTSNIIPNNKRDMNKYNKFFKAEENQCLIKCCYDDIPCLQEDEVNKNNAALSLSQTLDIEWKSGIITRNEWRTARGWKTIAGGDIYYSVPTITDPSIKT